VAEKIALVTGSSSGIGLLTVVELARAGFQVVASMRDVGRRQPLDEAAAAAGVSGRMDVRRLDITQFNHIGEFITQLEHDYGRLDVLVNNAGVGERADFRHLADEAWDRVWKTNLDGTVRCAREAFDLLKASGNASVINLSSIMASKHTRQMAVYSATKGAVSALSRSLAVEYAPYGIRVNTLLPGYVETALIGRYISNPMIAKALLTQTPLRRFGTPQDIANAALFLASDEAAYVTGAALNVDGGMATTL
jgi:NAD(P)-dependent dehydrogenase (short-subunit alcohol dehydrogenase family)